jgi:GDPmannose 4,6-dehydratase
MWRILHLLDHIVIHSASLESYASIYNVFSKIRPDECYHLAAQSYVSYSFEDEFSTFNTNINGTHFVLSALKETVPGCRFYFAASSEMFGRVRQTPQNERTPFHPRSAYGISKVAGFDLTRNYREAYSIHASSGILYNHESPRRGFEFVTRKISRGVARIRAGKSSRLKLGNLSSRRDWGHAEDYVKAMWMMLQQANPDDYVIASEISHSVKDFLEKAFSIIGLDYRDYVITDEQLFRPAEVDTLLGDASKAKEVLGWNYTRTFDELVTEMVEADLRREGV